MYKVFFATAGVFLLTAASFSCRPTIHEFTKGSYGYDAAFLKAYTGQVVELASEDNNARLLLSADYQGRVMTSTVTGDTGLSFGWLNYDLIASPAKKKPFNPVGGEERFWLGPEGGQYALYFSCGDSFNMAHWQAPPVLDTAAWRYTAVEPSLALFEKEATLVNRCGTVFKVSFKRHIRLLDRVKFEDRIQTGIPDGVDFVAYETINEVKNTGDDEWTPDKGLLSIGLVGMFTPSRKTTVILPFNPLPNAAACIETAYIGVVPPERLHIKDSVVCFACDGKYRSKIGLSPLIAKPVAGSYDAVQHVLTIIIPQIDKEAPYVNSTWAMQKEPYRGDVINSYNGGPLADGSQPGPFYELESSSRALALKKDESADYRQVTCHFTGSYEGLRVLAKKLLGVELNEL